MSDLCLKTVNLSKHFWIRKDRESVFRLARSFFTKEALKDEFWALRDVTLEIRKGEKIALVGRNGSGKTTFLRIITGIYDRTAGGLEVNEVPAALFKFGMGLHADLAVIDNIYLFGAINGASKKALAHAADAILNMAEVYHLRFSALKELSAGQLHRLALAIFFESPRDFLIFDESMTFVDQGFSRKCENYFERLSQSAKTVIMTSHDTAFLKKYCARAVWIDEGRIKADGNADNVLGAYEKGVGKK
jgi:ABC-type polysaccharide/polyol phosphate transport system ATPase subunit